MWALRILSGSQAGQVYPLKTGRNMIGRAPHCTIKLDNNNISKEHAFIDIDKADVVTMTDNNSRNGTFVNGTMIRKVVLKKVDKIAFHEVFCDLIIMPTNQIMSSNQAAVAVQSHQHQHQQAGNNNIPQNSPSGNTFVPMGQQYSGAYPPAHQQGGQVAFNHNQMAGNFGEMPAGTTNTTARPIDDRNKFQKYIDDILLPGIYKLTDLMEFKLVVGLFLLIYAFVLTALSTIPMIAITSESIQIESRRRALTIARNLASLNQQALLQENESALNTSLAEIEEGVSNVFIINQASGAVIAPATKSGSVPNFPFIETARREQKELVHQIDSSHIGVSVPLSAYNPETGGFNVKALAVVIYDMGSLAVEDGRTVSLFMQILCIAIVLSLILHFLFNKLIEYPIMSLNREVDLAIKNKSESTSFTIDFPIFEKLITNVNTLLNRVAHIKEESDKGGFVNKEIEASNLLHVLGYASIALNKDLNIIGVNAAFEAMLNVSDSALKNQPLSLIPDQALQKNIIELVQKTEQDVSALHISELEFGGVNSQVSCLGISDGSGICYFVSSIVPLTGGGG
jgi:hypothetical protein